jgi:cyclic pyranopterin phosphate synthase
MIDARWPIEPLDRNYHGEVASRYTFRDGAGEIGFIQSVTKPFCGDCTRARLSSDGKLFTCLFADHGVDLREPLRAGVSDEELLALVQDTWRKREDRYSEVRREATGQSADKVEMYYIGG